MTVEELAKRIEGISVLNPMRSASKTFPFECILLSIEELLVRHAYKPILIDKSGSLDHLAVLSSLHPFEALLLGLATLLDDGPGFEVNDARASLALGQDVHHSDQEREHEKPDEITRAPKRSFGRRRNFLSDSHH